jgi:hypothetical protein
MIAFISSLPFVAMLKSAVEKILFSYLVLEALRNKDNVAATYVKGSFQIVATGSTSRKLP